MFPQEVIDKVINAFNYEDGNGRQYAEDQVATFVKLDNDEVMFKGYALVPNQPYDLRELNYYVVVHNVKRVHTTSIDGWQTRIYEKRIPGEKSYIFYECRDAWYDAKAGRYYIEW